MPEAMSAGANLAATNDAMQGIIDSANKGQFQVTPEAGDELIKIFQEVEDFTLDMQTDLQTMKIRTPLGDSPGGQAMADFNQDVAAGSDGRSYEELINQLQERVPKVIDAIRKGIALYQEVDEGNSNFGVQT
ncbi:hypothetical protein [Parasphingorhabdus pacifica]